MKFYTLTLLLLITSNAYGIRNLFLPKTGEINIHHPSHIAENLSNVTNLQALLGAGRSLAYPFAAGVLLSIATLASENNWKVSDAGFSEVLGVPRDEIVPSYGKLLDLLETDENVTLSNILFSLRPNYSPSDDLTETLMTEVREVTWTRDTWLDTYNLMVEHLSNVTNEKIDTLLIPSVTKIGTPFRKSTQGIALSSFHYINGWQYPWTYADIGNFGGNEGIPYLQVEGTFQIAEEAEYTAVSIPLEGGMKSMVFVLPHFNVSAKYFRTQPEDQEESIDIVPFPKAWKSKKLRVKVPAFNTTDVDQYGQELEQVGMNETFCTIHRDFFGRYPYYMRPLVQVNYLDFNEDYLELASASGVAIEKFQSLLSLLNEINNNIDGTEDDDEIKKQSSSQTQKPTSLPGKNVRRDSDQEVNSNKLDLNDSRNASVVFTNEAESDSSNELPTFSLDRSFLWYLNDTDVGPLFFGTVEILVNVALAENSTEPEDEMTTLAPSMETTTPSANNEADIQAYLAEIEKFYLWSCRSFVPTSGGSSNISSSVDGKRRIPSHFSLSFDEDEIRSNNSASSLENGKAATPHDKRL